MITLKVSGGLQKFEIFFAKEGSGLEFFSRDVGHVFESNVGNDFRVTLRREGLQEAKFADDIVCIHVLIYRVQLKILLLTKEPRCCIALSFFENQNLRTLYILGSAWTIRTLVGCRSHHCSSILFVVFTTP